jgi:hypothetical protein
VTGGGKARRLQHGASTGPVGGPGLEDGYLSAPEDEQLPAATQDGAAAGQSPSRGATPTSSRSSRLSYYPDDGCRGTAGTDLESYSEPLELIGPGRGRSSTSTLLPGYPGPPTNVIGKNKGGCWVCGSLKHRKTFCPIWNQALANSCGTATRKTAKRDPRRNPAAQPRVHGRAGAPQPQETAVASGGRKVWPQHQLVDGHHPHDSCYTRPGKQVASSCTTAHTIS